MASGMDGTQFVIESRMRDAARGNVGAYFELGMLYSTGAEGLGIDLIEAHKWFNLAAIAGNERAQECRCEIAEDMTAREIVEAQKAARAWLQTTARAAA